MRLRNINSLLAIIFAALMITSTATVFATTKPTIPNPAQSTYPAGTIWATNLRFENVGGATVSEVFYGLSNVYGTIAAAPDPPAGLIVEFLDATLSFNYQTVVNAQAAEPASYFYQVQFRKVKNTDPYGGTVSSTMGSGPNNYVPEDFSVVLENTAEGIHINLRAGSDNVGGAPRNIRTSPILAGLYVDNAVNVTVSPGSQTGAAGSIQNYTVTVNNTGAYNDTYNLSATSVLGATITFDSLSLPINAGNNASTTMHVTLQPGNDTITIEATGAYAADEVTCTSFGLPISVSLTPSTQYGWPGDNQLFTVTVTNLGLTADNYQLTLGDSLTWNHGWDAPSQVPGAPIYGNVYGSTDNTFKDYLDTSIRENTPNFSRWGQYNLYAGKENNGGVIQGENAYMMWHLADAGIPGGAIIDNAYIWVVGTYGPSHNPGNIADNTWLEAWSVTDDTWNGLLDNITWTTGGPAMVTLQDNIHWIASAWIGTQHWWSLNVTPFVQSQLAGDNVASFGFTSNGIGDSGAGGNNGWWNSRDNHTEGTPAPYPDHYFRSPWMQISYHTVGIVGYTPSENTVILGPGASWTGTVWVITGASGTDTKTVTATSMSNPINTANASADAIANVAGVTVTPPANQLLVAGLYTVPFTITNNGNLSDTFNLVLSNPLGWTITGLPASVVIPAGGSVVENLSVTVPATPGAIDNIDVEATSVGDPSKTDTESTLITVKSGLAQVEVTILPGENVAHVSHVNTLINPAWTYDPLTFVVQITNKGKLDDKYELSLVSDNSEMGLKLTPDEIFLPAGDTGYAALSITLPDSWLGNMSGTVTVIATGMMSKENQVNIFPVDNDNVTVISGVENSVQKQILPDNMEPQTGAPGSPLVWVIVVKNTSNVTKDITLTVNDIATTVSSASAPRTLGGWAAGWGAALDNYTFLGVSPESTVLTYIRVTVPSDAKTSEWDTIWVTASVPGAPIDNEWVKAHVVEAGPRIPEGQIEISVEAQVVSIEVWPNTWNFGILDEDKKAETPENYFTVRNTGNVSENIYVRGTDAQSMPGEPVTTWTLDEFSIGTDQYMLKLNGMALNKTGTQQINGPVAPGNELHFNLAIQAPSAITTPARMFARIKLTAVSNLWP